MHTDFTSLLEHAIQSLVQDNKNPSVALIKSRLTSHIPMPLIISALQRWKNSGVVPKIEMVTPEQDANAKIKALEKQVKMLTTRLDTLEQHLKG